MIIDEVLGEIHCLPYNELTPRVWAEEIMFYTMHYANMHASSIRGVKLLETDRAPIIDVKFSFMFSLFLLLIRKFII